MDISQRGIDFIVSFEGKKTLLSDGRYKSYLDTLAKPNVWTIWAGLTKGVGKDTCWSEDKCKEQFAKELAIYEDAVEKYVKVPLNQNEFDALVSFTYNCGPNALKTSTLVKLLNQGKRQQAAAQFARWNKAGGKVWNGLVRRRAAEAALFLEPVPQDEPEQILVRVEEGEEIRIPDNTMPQRVEESKPPFREVVTSSWTIRGAVGAMSGAFVQVYSWTLPAATEAGMEAGKIKTSLSGWDALLTFLGANMGLLAAGFVVAGCAVVIFRRIADHREGRA